MSFSNNVLIESRSARDEGLACMSSQETQVSTLSKAKNVLFALWKGISYLTIRQVAEYYEVPENTIRQNYARCKTEFDSDGVLRVEGDDLKEVRDIMSLSSFSPRAVLFPARSVVRMGFILKDSAVAVQLRTITLNVLQGVGQVVDRDVLSSLILGHPILNPFCVTGELRISAPLADHYTEIEIMRDNSDL